MARGTFSGLMEIERVFIVLRWSWSMKVGDLVTYKGRRQEYKGMIGVVVAKHPKKRLLKVLMPGRSLNPIQIYRRHVELISESR